MKRVRVACTVMYWTNGTHVEMAVYAATLRRRRGKFFVDLNAPSSVRLCSFGLCANALLRGPARDKLDRDLAAQFGLPDAWSPEAAAAYEAARKGERT